MKYAMIDGIAFDGLIASLAFSSDAFVSELNEQGTRAQKLKIDAAIYRCHVIENFFCKLK